MWWSIAWVWYFMCSDWKHDYYTPELDTIGFWCVLLIIILNIPSCPDDMRIVGWWCSTPCAEAKETLDSFPYLVNFAMLYFLFRCPIPGVFLSSPHHSYFSSSSANAATASRAPVRSIPSCSHHRIPTCAPGALSDPSHRSNSDHVAIYYATVLWRRLMYSSIVKKFTPPTCAVQ